MPAQRLQPHKPSHRGGEETVENPEVSVCVGPEDLETTATKLTVYHGNAFASSTHDGWGRANLLLFGQNILVRLPVFSVFAEINGVGLDVALGRAGCYYTWKKKKGFPKTRDKPVTSQLEPSTCDGAFVSQFQLQPEALVSAAPQLGRRGEAGARVSGGG